MKDILLGIIIDMAEKEAFPEVDITLIVGGFVVSGYIISGKNSLNITKLQEYCTKVRKIQAQKTIKN